MLRVWIESRGGEMGGRGHFPDAGGTLQQAAIMLDALAIMNSAEAELRPQKAGERA